MHLEQPDSYLKTTNLIFSFDEVYFLLLDWWWDGVNLFEVDGEMEMSIFRKDVGTVARWFPRLMEKGVSTW